MGKGVGVNNGRDSAEEEGLHSLGEARVVGAGGLKGTGRGGTSRGEGGQVGETLGGAGKVEGNGEGVPKMGGKGIRKSVKK